MARTELILNPVAWQASNSITGEDFDHVNGMKFENGGATIFYIHNTSLNPVTITVVSVEDEAGRTEDYVKTVESDGIERFGPFRPRWWNQASEDDFDYVYVDATEGAGVKIYGVDLTRSSRVDENDEE